MMKNLATMKMSGNYGTKDHMLARRETVAKMVKAGVSQPAAAKDREGVGWANPTIRDNVSRNRASRVKATQPKPSGGPGAN